MILGSSVVTGAGRENPNLTSGSQASKKDAVIVNLDVSSPLDCAQAIRAMKDKQKLYYSMLLMYRN